MKLRTALTAAMSLLGLVTLLGAGSLMALTSYLHRGAVELRAGVESVRFAEEARTALLVHGRAADAIVQSDLAGALTRHLDGAESFVSTDEERVIVVEARAAVGRYLASRSPGRTAESAHELSNLDAAFRSLEALVAVNIDQAREAEREAAQWDRLGNSLALTVTLVLVVGVAGTVVWIRGVAFEPMFATGDAMRRFGTGDKLARAPEAGPEELREIAVRFNEMASNLGAQHERQMAFLAGVAHDLRNPLSALRISLALVRPDEPLPPEARLRRLMEVGQRQVDRLERMVSDFLDTARIEAGQLDLRLDEHDAREMGSLIVDLLRPTAGAHALTFDVGSSPVLLRCDAHRIEQVLTNLLSNAIKYSPDGGEVRLTVTTDARWVTFDVEDHGLGIPADELERVFEPFRRGRAKDTAIPGVGLGLFVARRITEAHGGTLTAKSVAGEGSVFSLRLPVEGPAPEAGA